MASKRLAGRLADLVVEVRRREFTYDDKSGRAPDLTHTLSRDQLAANAQKLSGARVRELMGINRRQLAEMDKSEKQQAHYDRMTKDLQGLFGSDDDVTDLLK